VNRRKAKRTVLGLPSASLMMADALTDNGTRAHLEANLVNEICWDGKPLTSGVLKVYAAIYQAVVVYYGVDVERRIAFRVISGIISI
jgi:hypothetical protein